MTNAAIREEVRKLPRNEQLSLIQYIVQVLQEEDEFVLSEAWKEELDRRDEDYRAGKEKLHTWAEAKNMIAPQS
ncbi:MAG: addiction module protein [Lewinellaceae bacterium]|nr:addiction module protein [Saprospiraceae bacterium]MCB9337956.1 addiction module protein [Lewinellaceae bacterium]